MKAVILTKPTESTEIKITECPMPTVKPGWVLVRGGTCALGYAAVQLAKALGCQVTATTHKECKMQLLTDCGADTVVLDNGSLKGQSVIRAILAGYMHGMVSTRSRTFQTVPA